MYKKALDKEIKEIKLLCDKDIYKVEPNLQEGFKKALYIPNTGVVCSYDLALAYGEVAFDNGVKFKLEEEVLNIEKHIKGI